MRSRPIRTPSAPSNVINHSELRYSEPVAADIPAALNRTARSVHPGRSVGAAPGLLYRGWQLHSPSLRRSKPPLPSGVPPACACRRSPRHRGCYRRRIMAHERAHSHQITCIGLDLAWSPRNPTGAAVIHGDLALSGLSGTLIATAL